MSVKNEDGLSIRQMLSRINDYIKFLFTKWLIIFSFGIVGLIIGFIYAKYTKPTYTAVTTFVLEDSDKSGGGGLLSQYSGLASMAGIDVGGGGGGIFQGDNIIELYKSRLMIVKTLLSEVEFENKRESLIDRYVEFNELRERWKQNPQLKDLKFNLDKEGKFTRIQDSVLNQVVSDIGLHYLDVTKPDKKLSIIKVEIKSNDEFFAATFNSQIVKNVNDFYVETKTKKSIASLSILQHQTDSVKEVLNGAIIKTVEVNDATPNLNITRQVLRAPAQRSQLNAEANKAILTQLVQNLELAKITLRKETPLIQVIDTPVFPLVKTAVGKFRGMLAGGLLFGLIITFILVIRKFFSEID